MAKEPVTAFCRLCERARYVSKEPLDEKIALDPSLFVPLEGAPAPQEGPALCYVCKNSLVFMRGAIKGGLGAINQEETFRPQQDDLELFKPEDNTPIPVRSNVDVVFELDRDEEMRDFQNLPDVYLVMTNRRIVRVRKG